MMAHANGSLAVLREIRSGRTQHATELLERELDAAVICVSRSAERGKGICCKQHANQFLQRVKQYRDAHPTRPKVVFEAEKGDKFLLELATEGREEAEAILNGQSAASNKPFQDSVVPPHPER